MASNYLQLDGTRGTLKRYWPQPKVGAIKSTGGERSLPATLVWSAKSSQTGLPGDKSRPANKCWRGGRGGST
jgi:hypothetical protein